MLINNILYVKLMNNTEIEKMWYKILYTLRILYRAL